MKKTACIVSALVLLASFPIVRAWGPGGNGVLSRLALEDGSEHVLTQEWNGWTEPYTVEFWFRQQGGEWGWCYVDHEALRWRKAILRHDAERRSIEVLRAGVLEAELFLDRGTFALHGRQQRELEAPQEIKEPRLLVSDSR